MMIRAAFIFLLLLLLMTRLGCSGRVIAEGLMSLTSDRIGGAADYYSYTSIAEKLNLTEETTVTCKPTYGFLPCTTKLWGQLFLIAVYEYLVSLGDHYIAAGSELFFNLIGPGIFGASLFQILGSIPVTVLILASGLSGSTKAAEEQGAVGMGLLAGSAVLLLTIVWGTCVALGCRDFSKTFNSVDIEDHENPFSCTGTGVSTDVETSYTARIMVVSMVPFIILQLPKILNSSSGTRVAILVALIVTLLLLFAYCFYQVLQPWIQNRRLEYLMHKYADDKLLALLTRNGRPNITFMKDLFHEVDKNKNAHISADELRVLILGIQLGGSNANEFVENFMKAFDTSGDARIDEAEFLKGMLKYVSDGLQSVGNRHNGFHLLHGNAKSSSEEQESLVAQRWDIKSASKSWLNWFKASFLLLLGIAISAILAEPLIDSVDAFGKAANISSFYVSYIVIPLAINYRQALAAINAARQKTEKAISLTLSEIYGAVFMNNMTGLVVFLAPVYIKDLSWDVSAEVLVVLIICTGMGTFNGVCTKFPLWTCFVAFLLYPISLLLLYVLTSVLGWS